MVSIDGYLDFFQVRRRGDNEVGIDIGVRKKSDWHGLGTGDAREKEILPLGIRQESGDRRNIFDMEGR